MKMEEGHPRKVEMNEKGLIYMATAKREDEGFKLEVAINGMSTSEAIEVATSLLYSTVEQVCMRDGVADPMELLIAELEMRKQQDAFRKDMMQRLEDQLGPKPEKVSCDELSRLLKGLGLAMKLKRDLGL